MTTVTKGFSMFVLAILVLALLVMIVLGFMLGFTHPLPWVLIGVLVVIPWIHDKIVSRRFVKWDDAMSVGNELIDKDHKKLLGMINQLQTAAHYQTDTDETGKILDDLVAYTRYHFEREEQLMQQHHYTGYDAHKQQHDAMVKQVLKFIDEYRIDNTRTIENVAQYLKTWLVNHINGSDQEYVPYLKDKK